MTEFDLLLQSDLGKFWVACWMLPFTLPLIVLGSGARAIQRQSGDWRSRYVTGLANPDRSLSLRNS
jgi:hypothetical protein